MKNRIRKALLVLGVAFILSLAWLASSQLLHMLNADDTWTVFMGVSGFFLLGAALTVWLPMFFVALRKR